MKLSLALLAVVIILGPTWPALGQEPPKPVAELKVLDRIVGTWSAEYTCKPGVWMPDGKKSSGTVKYEWILDGRYLQGKTSGFSDKSESIWLITYDPQMAAYRTWWFGTLGQAETRGQWHTVTKELTLKGVGPDGEFSWTEAWRFPTPDRSDWTGIWKDKGGQVVMEIGIKYTRKK